MLLATLVIEGREVVAAVSSDASRYQPLGAFAGEPVGGMIDLIRRYAGTDEPPKASGPGRDLAGIEVAPPLRPLRIVMCVGKNYRAHAEEFAGSGFDGSAGQGGEAVPSAPIIFTKAPDTVVATGEAIRYPARLSDSIDYEAELAVVIGKGDAGSPGPSRSTMSSATRSSTT